jgi:diguanylate cyclase (GGDEF)-like protein
LKIYSLRYRMAIAVFILEAIMMGLVLGKTLTYAYESTGNQIEKSDEVILDLLSTLGKTALFTDEYHQAQYNFEQAVKDPHILRIILINNEDRIVVSTKFEEVGSKIFKLESTKSQFWRSKDLDSLGKLAILFSNEYLDESIKKMIHMGIIIAISGMLIILLSSLTIGHFLTRRLTILTDKATQFSNGNMRVKTGFKGKDEVAIVGQAFDQMVTKVRESFYALQEARDDLEEKVKERTQELTKLNRKLKQLSETDSLTTIPNRSKFDKFLEKSWFRSKRHHDNVTVLLIDVDFFKLYNDNYGHKAGDECLTKVARAIFESVNRSSDDLVARYGGEEFAVILQSTDLTGGKIIATKIQQSISNLKVKHEFSQTGDCLTVSIGIALMDAENDVAADDVVKRADLALYEAKDRGRNCFVVMNMDGGFEFSDTD